MFWHIFSLIEISTVFNGGN